MFMKKMFVPPKLDEWENQKEPDEEEQENLPATGTATNSTSGGWGLRSSERHLMHNPQSPRAVTFYNFDSSKLLHYACHILDDNPILIANDNRRGSLDWSIQPATSHTHTHSRQPQQSSDDSHDSTSNNSSKSDYYLGPDMSSTNGTFEEILQTKTRTFCVQGIELRNENFKQNGLEQVQAFYERGGTVVFVGGGDCRQLNNVFGCQWTYGGRSNYTTQDFECIPTPQAQQLFGIDPLRGYSLCPQEIYIKDAILIEVPKGEALFLPRPFENKKQFMKAANIPILNEMLLEEEKQQEEEDHNYFDDQESDDSDTSDEADYDGASLRRRPSRWYNTRTDVINEDKFYKKHPNNHADWGKIRKREEQWKEYVPPTATPLAIHRARGGGGTLIWIGDQYDIDTNMRFLLKRLLTMDFYASNDHHHAAASIKSQQDKKRYDAPQGKYKVTSY